MVRVGGTLKEYAELGDAIVNFVVSAALTVETGRPVGVKVPDKVLRRVARGEGLTRRGPLQPEDLFEALAARAWLEGFSCEEMINLVMSGLRRGDLETGLRELLRALLNRVELLSSGAAH